MMPTDDLTRVEIAICGSWIHYKIISENVYMKMELHFFNAFFNFLKMISQVSKGRELKICKRNANGQ